MLKTLRDMFLVLIGVYQEKKSTMPDLDMDEKTPIFEDLEAWLNETENFFGGSS